ncbi:site-specific integrase [Nocardioides psychrotolerans]|uniref:tyrosine-type recombinase/integrase n=1 Tax=Nocardioides psychrotolerans TaxID=1005945 RepID=UPI00313823CA
MWIEKRGQQHRVYWRNQNQTGPKKSFEPFGTRDQAELFRQLARASSLPRAVAYVRNPSEEALMELLGRRPLSRPAETSTAVQAVAGVLGSSTGVGDRYNPRVGVTFAHLWQRWLNSQRHLEESTHDLYEQYGQNHLLPFFREIDLGLIQRAEPLRAADAVPGTVYVDDWVRQMLAKPRRNNAQRPIKDSKLSIKFIRNVHTVLKQVLQFAVDERPALLEINPAREIRLPKQDRREMFFLQDAAAYVALRAAMDDHFRPLLDFLVGTGARFGEAAGLLVRHLHLDVDRPYVDIRVVLKWARKKWKLGRPKTKSSVRRITLSPKLVEVLRPLVDGKADDEHVFTMVEGGPLHHGNFYNRYFRPAVKVAGKPVPSRLRIHDLRHTHAAWLLSDGVPSYVVQRRLGHSSSLTTENVYGHLTPDADDRTLRLVDRRLPDFLVRDDEGAVPCRLSKWESALPEFDVDDEDDLAA